MPAPSAPRSADDPTDPSDPAGVTVSEERFASLPSGITLCYQTFGDPAGEPLLLVMGLGGPMTWWHPALCAALARAGFLVVRYDNRDVGRSSRARGQVTRAMLARAFLAPPTNRVRRPPYTLDDMAEDATGLLDHLGIDAAHVAGVSMGGMIAQTLALLHPERVRSLTSIMSTTGRRVVGWQDPRLLPLVLRRSEAGEEGYVAGSARLWRLIGSPGYPEDRADVDQRASETWQRGVSAAGVSRQTLAILSQPDRSRRLRRLTVPTLVIHGTADKMVHVSGGRATARAVPGAELVLVPGMGHDIPVQLHALVVDGIRRTADRAA